MRTIFRAVSAALAMVVAASTLCIEAKDKDGNFVLVVDAGHGGGDVGTPHRKQKMDEKDIALNVALRLGRLVEQEYKDVKVVYTRTRDVYPSLPRRTQIAREAQGDLYISVHVNSAADKNARGFEIYTFGVSGLKGKTEAEQKRLRERSEQERENLDISGNPVDFERDIDMETKILCQTQREKHNKFSVDAAEDIQNSLIANIRRTSYKDKAKNRGIKAKNIFVLCYVPMPAVLIELGYMTNPDEEKFINTKEAQEVFARGIVTGFQKYKRAWDKRQLPNAESEAKPDEETKPAETKAEPKPQPAAPKVEQKAEPKQQPAAPKPEVKKEEPKPEKPAPAAQAKASDAPSIVYKVQFLSVRTLLKEGDAALKGLAPVSYYKDGDFYRYTYGEAPSVEALRSDLQKVRKLFGDAFPAKFDSDGKRIR